MQYTAFLRGMNVGGHRITNVELCDCFRELGIDNPWAFLASGNVAFESSSKSKARLSKLIQNGLHAALGYDVPTFLRTADEVAQIATNTVFTEEELAAAGKVQVCLLARTPDAATRKKALSFALPQDNLAIDGQELYWLPAGRLTDSELDHKGIAAAVGPMTVRTLNTMVRLAKKFK